jgi:hypothetical protein
MHFGFMVASRQQAKLYTPDHIRAGTGPHLRRDRAASAPGPGHIRAGTGPHPRRDRAASAPGLKAQAGLRRPRRALVVMGTQVWARVPQPLDALPRDRVQQHVPASLQRLLLPGGTGTHGWHAVGH